MVNDITERFKAHGAAGLVHEERERLRKFGESVLRLDSVSALPGDYRQASGDSRSAGTDAERGASLKDRLH